MSLKSRPRMTSFTGRSFGRTIFLGLFIVVTISGCAEVRETVISDAQLSAYLADKPPQLKPFYEKVLREGNRNMVLNQMQAGLAAMELGQFRLAEESFDQALLGIEAVYADNEQAENARSLWRKEGSKDFKGEPYERVMAYYYRGLLYILRGDYENARACFKSGIMQDAVAEEAQYRCDFALMIFLEGWASQQLGAAALAKQSYDEAKTFRPDYTLPADGDNCLILVETGTSPVKLTKDEHHAMLSMARGEGFRETWARVSWGNKTVPAYRMEDIYWQSATRGGRMFDGILAGKVTFKNVNETMGSVLQSAGVAAMRSNDSTTQAIGAAVAILGTAQRIMAGMVETEADTRYWNNLPDSVHVVTTKMASGSTKEPALKPGEAVHVSFYDMKGGLIPELRRNARVHSISSGRNGLVWVRSRSALSFIASR